MLRLFEESKTRRIHALDGQWRYCIDPDGVGQARGYAQALPQDAPRTIIPSCWQNEPGLIHYEGSVWYQTGFDTTLAHVRLVFGAVNNECAVYVDGAPVGYHYGGFTEFAIRLPNLTPGRHTLTLRVSNIHNTLNTLPLTDVDWFHYGGIIRSVEVHEITGAAIERMRIDYQLNPAMTDAQVTVTASLYSPEAVCGEAVLTVDGKNVQSTLVRVQGETALTLSFPLCPVTLWSPQTPVLYEFALSFDGDELIDRTGFRTIQIRDGQFYLNGRRLWMRGINRHEEHPDWGFAVPMKLNKRDIDLIRMTGCNIIRGSHYPNAKATLDYMDETGMLFWEEIPMWRFPAQALADPLSQTRAREMVCEMVSRDFNHPCILIWGMNNEVENTSRAAWQMDALLGKTLRALDSTRLITYATDLPLQDICYEHADFISVNYYIGWYGPQLDQWPAFLDQLTAYLAQTGNGEKPVVLSEFGAGGIYGETAFEDVLWTENYQQRYLDYTLRLFLSHPRLNGTFIWQYADLRCCLGRERTLGRPRSFNNKGLLNEYRHPKLAYYTVRDLYCEAAKQE